MFNVASVIARYNAESGGPPRTVSEIAAAGLGHWQSHLITTDYTQSHTDRLLVDEFPGNVKLMPSRAHSLLGGWCMLAGLSRYSSAPLVHGKPPDVIHVHGIWSPYIAAFAFSAIRHRIPLVVTPHGMLEPWSMDVRATRKSLLMKLYQRRILEGASALHATSKMEADNFRRLGLVRAPIFIVPNSVALPPQMGHRDLPGNEKKVLLFLSRIHEKKGLDILLRAWNETRPRDWRLLIVGSGEQRYLDALKHYCASNQVPDVEFKPHTEGDERERLFRESSAFILPTYSENFGNAVAEALIRGLPVITTTGTPWSDIIEQQCGWYVRPTVGELKRIIGEATATDRRMLILMGGRARDYATRNFTKAVVRDRLLGMYRSAIENRAGLDGAGLDGSSV